MWIQVGCLMSCLICIYHVSKFSYMYLIFGTLSVKNCFFYCEKTNNQQTSSKGVKENFRSGDLCRHLENMTFKSAQAQLLSHFRTMAGQFAMDISPNCGLRVRILHNQNSASLVSLKISWT